jgi:tetratricopeptide (TPR) repeat protein
LDLVAATIALILVAAGVWFFISNKTSFTEQLASKYYKPAYPILQIRSGEVDAEEGLKAAFKLYKENDFKNALKCFKTLETQPAARFYSAICYIELGRYDDAIDVLEKVVEADNNLFVEQAEWYIGLIYLMNNQKKDAVRQFTGISDSSYSYFREDASDILKYLN